ncbi:hypothetical protein LEP1GSC133_4226 [Leptospira borgpetersenii serovar Pomona str. 200901868]|uniref:Uncharacterized protein n=2 Tax=Leptospira borgpetersenii TaxID=174 RepID=M3H0Y6_LEPBO|nr:hypothetical protein LEP1GSC123_0547 [Leptospira borgpetersenii str. 200701203]EMO09613.1 hypothetical protein LEP1GSC137_3581 [Leptospira borgpetersenii str. Noumea 25]EMO62793.1 hypothetical protein LEP1GSC133_4226 [Leptospira borgpetersenii serovar Pomona str. 200901868]
MGRLGILAGGGELPHIGMKEALAAGEDPIFFPSSNPTSMKETMEIATFRSIS